MKKAFTLIELLVVVLIIGILAAIALPQYQKAVQKSKAAELQTLITSVVKAQDLSLMDNGSYATTFDNLNVDIPLPISANTQNESRQIATCATNLVPTAIKKNDEIEIALYNVGVAKRYYVGAFFTTGRYKCTGFLHVAQDAKTYCAEGYYGRYCGEKCGKGDFCNKVMGLKSDKYWDTHWLWW